MQDKSSQKSSQEEVANIKDDEYQDEPLPLSAIIKISYREWFGIMMYDKERNYEQIEFDTDTENWDFTKSVFADPGAGQPTEKPNLPKKK
jgi:hypothetical protein